MFVVYETLYEVLVTTKENETVFLTEMFGKERDVIEYDRTEINDNCVMIQIAGFKIR